jgi:hypothetical protein
MPGKPISGGVGADGRLVAVATAKGEVLAFDSSGKALWTARVTSEVLAAPQLRGRAWSWCAAATTASSVSMRRTASANGCTSAARRPFPCAATSA